MITIHLICAARPNFMKIAPLYHVLKHETWCEVKIVHAGHHYDYQMSQAFFDDFGLPEPHYHLDGMSGTHAEQTAQTMVAYEKLCLKVDKPNLVIVVGDVNATLACAIVAKKLHLKLIHLEAGLRSFDRSMPEEINRLATDAISDEYWTPSEDANINLLNEGVPSDRIRFVGNIMIDSYCMMQDKVRQRQFYTTLNVMPKRYGVITLHRPVNVDSSDVLKEILSKMSQIALPLIFPVHPRTKKALNQIPVLPQNLHILDPLGYIDFMSLVSNAAYVISDSGGVQEETTYLGIPCFTLRDSTERPITVSVGTNELVNMSNVLDKIKSPKQGRVPALWDGETAVRIKNILRREFFVSSENPALEKIPVEA